MDNIICPHCGKDVEISEAIVHQLSQKVREEERKLLQAQFEKEKAKEAEEKEKLLRKEFEEENKQNEKALFEAKKAEQELKDKLERQLKEREEAEEKIKEDAKKAAQKEAQDAQALTLKEKDIQMEQVKKLAEELRRANEDLKKKLEQGSQQLQGEALELNLEEKLKDTFPNDEFLPIPKGVEGADIWQKIKFNGKVVGSIVWETKRTKAWSNSWLTKLKDDSAKVSASEAIIVSQILPEGVTGFDRKDGIWVTSYENAINICRFVRYLITNIATAKSGASHTEEEWSAIRDYIISDSFKHRMQAHFDAVNALRDSLEKEKRSATLRWKEQEKQVDKLDMNTANFYGELKAIVSNLPELSDVETPQLIEAENDSTLF